MNLIDGVESSFKAVILRLFKLYREHSMDDTEYIQNIRAVLQAADDVITQHADVIGNDRTLLRVLADYARKLWLDFTLEQQKSEKEAETIGHRENIDGYYAYYYDYIYTHNIYPD